MNSKTISGIVIAIIFVIGAGYIMYAGRPVMQLVNTPAPSGSATSTTSTSNKTFTMAEVQTHNTQASCWSAIGGDVYDLTTWISRHPGGANAIIGLCGTDGTDAYTNQHGGQGRPRSILALLKIGSIK